MTEASESKSRGDLIDLDDPPVFEKSAGAQSKAGWKRRALSWLKCIGFGLLAVILLVHVYALILWFAPVPVTLNMMGSVLVGETLDHRPVSLSKISPHLVRAVIAAEDSRFCQHKGLDIGAIRKAVAEHKAGGRRRGASTISQQTAKNAFLWNGGGIVRKAGEAWMTLVTETVWGKKRIMTHYLNIAEWGDGIYGAEAAAQRRYSKPANDLTLREAALLAAVLPSPNKWRVDPPGNYVSGRAGTIQQRMGIVSRDKLADCVL
jgi:monofunctional biosynthetic peptidoglycan transglycosylase